MTERAASSPPRRSAFAGGGGVPDAGLWLRIVSAVEVACVCNRHLPERTWIHDRGAARADEGQHLSLALGTAEKTWIEEEAMVIAHGGRRLVIAVVAHEVEQMTRAIQLARG